MMKRRSNFKFALIPIIIALIGSLLPNAFSVWAGGDNKNISISKNTSSVCYIDDPKYSFPTIESAVDAASKKSGGQKIYVIPGTKGNQKTVRITEGFTLSGGDSLILPYEGTNVANAASTIENYNVSAFATNSYRTLEVILSKNKSITIDGGSLIIGAVFGCNATAGPVSFVSDLHTQLTLEENSTINVKSNPTSTTVTGRKNALEALGYIRRVESDAGKNTAKVSVLGGTLMTLFVSYDMKGGRNLADWLSEKDKRVFPTSDFDFPNLETKIVINYGGTLEVMMRFNVNATDAILKLVSNSDALFVLNSGSYAEMIYTPKTYATPSKDPANNQHTTHINLFGSCSVSTITLDLGTYMLIYNLLINSYEYFLPFCYRYKIECFPVNVSGNTNTLNFDYDFKLMSGCKVIINEGITFNLTGKLIIHSKNYNDNPTGADGTTVLATNAGQQYPFSVYKEGATFILNGQANISGFINGIIHTTVADAKINFLSAPSTDINFYEYNGYPSAGDVKFIQLAGTGTVGYINNTSTLTSFEKKNYTSEKDDNSGRYFWSIPVQENPYLVIGIDNINSQTSIAHNTTTAKITFTISSWPENSPYSITIYDSSKKAVVTITTNTYTLKNLGTNSSEIINRPITFYAVGQLTQEGYTHIKSAELTINITQTQKPAQTTCLLANTRILLSNGQSKLVKDIQKGDEVLTFNHLTGTFNSSELIFNVYVEKQLFDVITLEFDNGNKIKLATGHGFFNVNRNTYEIYYGEEFYNHIGETFLAVDYNSGNPKLEKTKLINVSIKKEYVEKYSPLSEYDINCVTDGMLTIPDDIEGMFDSFSYNEDFTYNLTALQEDIEKYGVYTYEDVKDVVHPYVFEVFNFKYWKAFIGKGSLTYDKVNHWISTYMDQIVAFNNLDWDTSKQVPLGPQHG